MSNGPLTEIIIKFGTNAKDKKTKRYNRSHTFPRKSMELNRTEGLVLLSCCGSDTVSHFATICSHNEAEFVCVNVYFEPESKMLEDIICRRKLCLWSLQSAERISVKLLLKRRPCVMCESE